MSRRYEFFRRLTTWAALCVLAGCTASNTAVTPLLNAASPERTGSVIMKPGTYYGCPEFKNGTYTRDITSAPIDPNSAAYISSVIQAGDSGGFYASTGVEQVNLANPSTQLYQVQPRVKWHQFPKPYPWQSGYYIEPLSDEHAMVVQTRSCHLFEAYGTQFAYSTLSAYCGANWSLARRFVPLPPGTPSAMASGLPLFAGMVRWEDYQGGAIDHALNWDGVAGAFAQYSFVRPASDTGGLPFQGSSSFALPWGAHLRLKASFSTQGWGPEATMVANAMKTYGVYLADTGSTNAIYFANAADGSDPWDTHDLSSLSSITINDFDVLTLGQILTVPGH